MNPMSRLTRACALSFLLLAATTAPAQDANVTQTVAELERLLAAEPLVIQHAEISRPKAKGDITLKADVSFGGAAPLRVKLRKSEPGAETFNNVPRYDLAAYELQKLFIDPLEYVVPPTALRFVPLADFAKYSPDVKPTFPKASQVLAVVQYWLNDIKVVADVYDAQRFGSDPVYARHIGQLNVLTYLVQHRDSNVGNFLIGRAESGARVFSIDHGVAFASGDSDRGELWKDIRVEQLPADTVERLRKITPDLLAERLGVLAQWELKDGAWAPVEAGSNLSPRRGVRRSGTQLQMGLTRLELQTIERLLGRLLERIDRGEIATVDAPAASIDADQSTSGAQGAAAPNAQAEWRNVERVVAFADVHGAYDELVRLLRETGIVDGQDRWAAGRAHVVSLGDLLDRGADSRKVMDLLMRLQPEARAAGGALHVVLGNHEAMNVLGDLRYVDPGEYAAYVDLEAGDERAQARAAWEAARGQGARAAFDQAFPPGYFGHRAALAPEGKYGQWLLGLPVAVVVNDTLFLHAGPSQALQGMGVSDVNTRYRTALVDYLRLAGQLEQAGLLQPTDAFNARPSLAAERLTARGAGASPPSPLSGVVQAFERADANPLLGPEGPNWYRGAALCNEAAETDVLTPLLEQFKVARIVVGHTPTRNQRAVTRFDGRVVKLDAGMNRAVYKGRAAALFIEGPRLSVRYAGEAQAGPLAAEGLYVTPDELDDAAVSAALSAGTVSVTGPRGPGAIDVVVEHQGRRVPAVFEQRNANAARKELAAYRLDRHLGLGIVPATVEREVQGQRGVLQARPSKWVTQGEAQRQALRGGGWCALEPQFQLVYAFDALIGNEGRTPETLLFDTDEWYVYATNHERAFGAGRAFPPYLKAQPPKPGPELRRRLGRLDEQALAAALGELVDARGRKAMLERREALLALPAAGTATGR